MMSEQLTILEPHPAFANANAPLPVYGEGLGVGLLYAIMSFDNSRDFQIKKHPTFPVGCASRPPVDKGGQDVHPTRWNNLFLGHPQ